MADPRIADRSDVDTTADIARCYARCFATADGARVLADLEAATLGRVLGPSADEAALRHLVMRLRALIARGRTGA